MEACPFCEGDEVGWCVVDRYAAVTCDGCGAAGPRVRLDAEDWEAEAVAKWDTQAVLTRLRAEVGRLERLDAGFRVVLDWAANRVQHLAAEHARRVMPPMTKEGETITVQESEVRDLVADLFRVTKDLRSAAAAGLPPSSPPAP